MKGWTSRVTPIIVIGLIAACGGCGRRGHESSTASTASLPASISVADHAASLERARLHLPEMRAVKSLVTAFLIIFPGRQTPMALSLATGIGISRLQRRVDQLEEQAMAGILPTEEDRRFLHDLYWCLARGGRLSIVLRQSGQLMQHYLAGSGDDLRIAPRIFLNSRPVQKAIESLKQRITLDRAQRGSVGPAYSSGTFYMGDPEFLDALTGLYFGRLVAFPRVTGEGRLVLRWRAELPWKWPSYESMRDPYGNYRAQRFAIPNARSWLQGSRYCLRIGDGLGAYLAQIGMAKPFLAYSDWEEKITLPARSAR